MSPLAALIVGYLAGSIPFAYLAGRLLQGIDLRTVGSGNLGATNVYRTLGAPAAIVVLLLDALKGALPVIWLPAVVTNLRPGVSSLQLLTLGIGVTAILGHAKPIFLLWKGGGKGVATTAGVFAALAPTALAIVLGLFAFILWRTRIASVASIGAALGLPWAVLLTIGPVTPLLPVAIFVALFVLWTHRANLARIRAGTEPRLGAPKSAAPNAASQQGGR
ncbi:MAG: hypothetical protein RL625_1402 [Gemmatimonadota bacterium]|jgi:glycerol-3-phosphate acyltransferase PlsY